MNNNNNQRVLEFIKGKEYVKDLLKPFIPYFLQKDIEDLQVHCFNEVTLLKTKGRKETIKDNNFNKENLEILIRQLANINQIQLENKDDIQFSRMLPLNLFRFSCKFGNSVKSGIDLSIRLNDNYLYYDYKDFGLEEFEFNFLSNHIAKQGHSAFFIGSTGSGKTTFASIVIQEISTEENMKIVGDIHDFVFKKEHKVNELYAKSQEQNKDSINHLVRSNPERILIPELTTENAQMILRTLGSGHSGFILTLHADTKKDSIAKAFEKNMINAKQETSSLNSIKEDLNNVDFFIYLKKDKQGKRVIEKVTINNEEIRNEAKELGVFGYEKDPIIETSNNAINTNSNNNYNNQALYDLIQTLSNNTEETNTRKIHINKKLYSKIYEEVLLDIIKLERRTNKGQTISSFAKEKQINKFYLYKAINSASKIANNLKKKQQALHS